MTYFLSGGSKSGKSMLAQQISKSLPAPHYYLATLRPTDEEDRAIVRRHLQERDGWGFETLEAARNLPAAFDRLPKNATVLFDSATALLANEMFRPDGTMDKDAGARSARWMLPRASGWQMILSGSRSLPQTSCLSRTSSFPTGATMGNSQKSIKKHWGISA